MPRRPADRAAELAAIETRYRARCDEINAERARFGEWYEKWRRRRHDKALEAGLPFAFYLVAHSAVHGRRPMTLAEADAKQAELLREARDAYLGELEALDLKARIVSGGARGLSPAEVRSLARRIVIEIDARKARKGVPEKRGPKPTPVPSATRRRVAELRILGTSVTEIMRDTGLSKTIATRLVRDVDDAQGRIRAGRY